MGSTGPHTSEAPDQGGVRISLAPPWSSGAYAVLYPDYVTRYVTDGVRYLIRHGDRGSLFRERDPLYRPVAEIVRLALRQPIKILRIYDRNRWPHSCFVLEGTGISYDLSVSTDRLIMDSNALLERGQVVVREIAGALSHGWWDPSSPYNLNGIMSKCRPHVHLGLLGVPVVKRGKAKVYNLPAKISSATVAESSGILNLGCALLVQERLGLSTDHVSRRLRDEAVGLVREIGGGYADLLCKIADLYAGGYRLGESGGGNDGG